MAIHFVNIQLVPWFILLFYGLLVQKKYDNFALELMFKNDYSVVFKGSYFYHKNCC